MSDGQSLHSSNNRRKTYMDTHWEWNHLQWELRNDFVSHLKIGVGSLSFLFLAIQGKWTVKGDEEKLVKLVPHPSEPGLSLSPSPSLSRVSPISQSSRHIYIYIYIYIYKIGWSHSFMKLDSTVHTTASSVSSCWPFCRISLLFYIDHKWETKLHLYMHLFQVNSPNFVISSIQLSFPSCPPH